MALKPNSKGPIYLAIPWIGLLISSLRTVRSCLVEFTAAFRTAHLHSFIDVSEFFSILLCRLKTIIVDPC